MASQWIREPEAAAARADRAHLGCQLLCDFVLTSFEGLLPFDRVALGLLLDGGASLWLAGASSQELPASVLRGERGRLDRGTLATVLAVGEPRVINDLASYARERPHSVTTQALVARGYASSLTAPLRHAERALGFLFFNSRAAHTYQPEHVETIRRVARAVAAVVAEMEAQGDSDAAWARALGTTLPALVRSAREAHEEEALAARVMALVNAGTSLAELLDAVYESFGALLPFDRLGFAVIDPRTRTVSARWARSNGPVVLGGGFTLGMDATSLPVVIESATPRILNDLPEYLACHPRSVATRLVVAEGMRASMTYFLGEPSRPLGFLFFNSRAAGAYGLTHVARLRKLTRRLTAAFEQAILFDQLRAAQRRTEQLLHLLVPPSIAARVTAGERDVVETLEATAVLCDLVGFSSWSASLSPLELFRCMSSLFRSFDARARALDVYRVRTMGDGYFAVAGVPTARADHAVAAARLALDMMRLVGEARRPDGGPMVARIGLHSGPVIAGVGGGEDLQYDVWGQTVTVAARLEASAEPGRIQVSRDTADLLRGQFELEPRGPIELKGIGMIDAEWLIGPEDGDGADAR